MGTNKVTKLLWLIFFCFVVINFLGVFVPEIGFDALWYHLTLPKLWLLKKQWHFDGGLLYYSVMPRLTETIFIPLIHLSGSIGPKLIQFLSGIGTSYLIWKISRQLSLTPKVSTLAVILYYCSWLISWESSSAYIDLFRGLLETLALYQFLFGSWIFGGIFLGLAIGTKWLALGSLLVYALVFGPKIIIPALVVSCPWFLVSFFYTGNPVYPLFSSILQHSILDPLQIFKQLAIPSFYLTFPFDDFINPLMGVIFIIAAFGIFSQNRLLKKISLIGIFETLSTLILDPPSARFLIPYLPALVIASAYQVRFLKKSHIFYVQSIVLLSAVAVLTLRLFAFSKNIPFLLGQEDANQYLTRLSGRLPDTFVDSDNFVAKNLSSQDKILIDKLHNLYYFPYDFDHTSWAKDLNYDYLITKDQDPNMIRGTLQHTNPIGIQVFKLNP